jgi:hypothetical protein
LTGRQFGSFIWRLSFLSLSGLSSLRLDGSSNALATNFFGPCSRCGGGASSHHQTVHPFGLHAGGESMSTRHESGPEGHVQPGVHQQGETLRKRNANMFWCWLGLDEDTLFGSTSWSLWGVCGSSPFAATMMEPWRTRKGAPTMAYYRPGWDPSFCFCHPSQACSLTTETPPPPPGNNPQNKSSVVMASKRRMTLRRRNRWKRFSP